MVDMLLSSCAGFLCGIAIGWLSYRHRVSAFSSSHPKAQQVAGITSVLRLILTGGFLWSVVAFQIFDAQSFLIAFVCGHLASTVGFSLRGGR